ncbi:MAG TPA: hypothetical protein VD973_28670 [Symbiobacteriaceae bacterium]|jgi:hypothetical protein|nr:hypothetical protein [Symbiobacteriaceae bacterium]
MVAKKPDGSGSDEQQNQPQKLTGPLSSAALRAAALARLQAALQAAASDPAKSDELKAAMQEAINAGIEVAPTLTSHESTANTIRANSRSSKRTVRRSQHRPFVWLKSPGTIIGGVQAKWLLQDNAKARSVKLKNDKVERIRTGRKDGDSRIYVWATDWKDTDGYEVEENGTDFIINIAEWMFSEEIAPAPGIKQKFDLVEAPELIQGLPALCINLDKARKTTTFTFSHAKKKEGQPDPKGTVDKKADPETKGPEGQDENEQS